MRRNSLAHVARGADGVLFFQWRASRAGAEKFHSALVPHAGTDTRVWREVVAARRDAQAGRRGARQPGARRRGASCSTGRPGGPCELDSHPSATCATSTWRTPCTARCCDAGRDDRRRAPVGDLSGYRLVLVPDPLPASPTPRPRASSAAVAAGGTALVTYFSGIVDENDHIRLGGYPGAFRELLGVRVEEFSPLREGEQVHLDDGPPPTCGPSGCTSTAPRRWRRTPTGPCRASRR